MMVLEGCNQSTEDNLKEDSIFIHDEAESVNGNIDIFDFSFINRAPKATEKHNLDEVIKFYFNTNLPLSTVIAIEVGNNEIYKEPRYSALGVDTFEEPIVFDDKATLVNILGKYNIQDWKEDYTTEDPATFDDGAGWKLLLQFEDGSTEAHGGEGTTDKIFPKEFDAFVEEIDQLAKEILGEDYKKDFNSEP